MAADNNKFYIEKDTNYALQVECATNINFDKIKRIAKFFVMQLPESVQNKIYNELDRGVNIIDSEPQLNMYLHSFGNMHQAKMRQAFSNIGTDWFGNKEIEIIDYGCGQALATMLYHDYLQANGISQTVSKITLIEPSEKALCRAGLHTKAFFPDAQINTINKLLNDVAPTDISHSGKPVLHLFSNIIDIEEVDLQHLVTLSKAHDAEATTVWVCISPFFGNHKDNRIPCFLDILNQPKTYTFQRSKGTWQNQWTINCIIAEQKTEENLSTKVTDEDEANGIRDKYGLLYSKDGKRLLRRCFLTNIKSYTVKEGTKVICDNVFSYNDSLQSIVIPKSVTKIGYRPFNFGIKLTSHSNRFIVENDLLIDLEEKRLIQCLKDKESIVIPDSVTKIGDSAFYYCKSLQSIVIPDSVTEIGDSAFYYCKSLQSIVIPDSVTEIGDWAFGFCESLQSIVIPDSVTEIGNYAFEWCSSLQSIVIPESVTEIGKYAFDWCSSLQSIVIPESVTKIGESAFGGCESLQSIIIPESVTEIGDRAFSSCKSLQSIVIPKSVTKIGYRPFNFGIKLTSHSNRFIVENDLLIDLEEKRLIQCLKDKESIVIPKIVTQIGDWALGGCTSLQSIVIPEAVTEIGDYAFSYCSSLQSIVIPDSVTKIGNYAFEWCSSLQSIVIPKGKKEYFERILDKKLHKLLKEIDEDNLSTEATKEDKANGIRDEYGVLYSQDSKRLLRGNKDITSYTIKEGTKVICDEAFGLLSKSSLQFIVIPDSVTKIGNKAFIGCHSLQNIVIPESVTEIGKWAFEGCQSLQSIVIPESVMQIGDTPFPLGIKITLHSNKFLIKDELLIDLEGKRLIQCLNDKEHIVIPDTITEIGNTAFYEYKSLQNIIIPNSVINIGHSAFYGCESLQSIVIPDSVTEIGNQAFYNCKSLQSIVIPESITKIGDGAFCGCDSLQSIVIPESVTEIGDEAFYVCESLHSIVIPDSVTKIGDEAFCGCDSLQSIVIPESVTKIGEGAFAGCESLQNIVIPESVTEVGSSPFPLGIDLTSHSSRFVVENDLLIDLKEKRLIQSLKDKEYAVIPESITTIGDDAFSDCTSLQNLIIPELIIKIGDRALRRCESLQYVVIPDSVTIIGNRAFDSCKVLQSIVIPKSVTEIGKWAFESCSSLQSIVIPNSVTKIGDWTFRNCSSLQSIVIPDSVTEIITVR